MISGAGFIHVVRNVNTYHSEIFYKKKLYPQEVERISLFINSVKMIFALKIYTHLIQSSPKLDSIS